MSLKPISWRPDRRNPAVEAFLDRPAFDPGAEAAARDVLAGIRRKGDRAVAHYVARFDGVKLVPSEFAVPAETIKAAVRAVSPEHRAALRKAHRRIAAFARAGMKKDWRVKTEGGGWLGEQFSPFDRVGVYVPGGEAPLVSTALMTATLAQVAGVREIVACTPCNADKAVDPALLMALDLAGATEIYRVGGIQSIGMLAYGTRTVRKVQKIVGPGGPFVTAAKRQVYGDVALDLVAGPSEIAVLADASANARWAAIDMLSQAEHGTGWEKALLVTTSAALARRVASELDRQAAELPREARIRKVLEHGVMLAVVRNLKDGAELCNRFAPEHLELMVRQANRWRREIRAAGAVFIGSATPESAGDFVAGPSHVLPTGGAAAMFSGLTVDDFRRRSSCIAYTRRDLRDALPVIEAFGALEGLEAHARSARMRFEKS